MTDDMGRLLRDASDDGGRPVGFAIEQLVTRGRHQVRVRRSGAAAVAGVVAVGAIVGGVSVLPIEGAGQVSGKPAPSVQDDAELLEHCAALDRAYRELPRSQRDGGDSPIDDWSIRVRLADEDSISMMLAPDDEREMAYCRLDLTGHHAYDGYWRDPYHSVAGADGAVTRIGGDREVWSSGGVVPERIGRITFKTKDGVRTAVARNGRYYVWQHHQTENMDPNPDPEVSDQRVEITIWRANGELLVRHNFDERAEHDVYAPAAEGRG